jgi:hypothetical protein
LSNADVIAKETEVKKKSYGIKGSSAKSIGKSIASGELIIRNN